MLSCKQKKLLLLIILQLVGSEGRVSVSEGVLTVDDKGNCTIRNNGNVVSTFGNEVLEGPYYGLITYECGMDSGWIVSKLECANCGLFCSRNEMITGCESSLLTFLMGCMVGIILSLIVFILIRKKLESFMQSLISWIGYKALRRSDKREEKKAEQLRSRTQIEIKPIYKESYALNMKHYNKLKTKRESSMTNVIMNPVALVVIFFICDALSCDNTLYIRSDGKVCDSMGCIETSMYELPLMTGSVVCFRDTAGELLKFKIAKATIRTRYNQIYYTSEYDLVVQKHARCKGAGGCWSGGCMSSGMHAELRKTKNMSITGYGCGTNTLGCDTWCAMGTSCTWWKWGIKLFGDYASVYEKISETWEVGLLVTYHNNSKHYTLNVNNPRVNLEDIMSDMPIYITGFTSELLHLPNGILVHKGKGYEMKVSSLNMPETDIIGDYQISLDHLTETYNTHSIKCDTESCEVRCAIPESKLRRFIRMADRFNDIEFKLVGDSHTLETERNVNSVINMLIGNVDIRNLQVEKAKCMIESIGTFSCIGCTYEPYAIFQSYNIKSEGIVPFESNCTFNKNYLSCSTQPYELKLRVPSSSCYVYIPSFNQTMYINFGFQFKGSLDPSKSVYSKETEVQAITNIITNQQFITGLMSTISLFGFISISMSLLLRLVKIYEVKRITKEIDSQ
ncbi:glycoprotein precursor [Anopheles stephensi orthophasmavirus]|nr:glycoprotein precursor [Anopheles stephensi orthophasmavirus]